jgi:hypothetical protein
MSQNNDGENISSKAYYSAPLYALSPREVAGAV